jgi:hypothetical protein
MAGKVADDPGMAEETTNVADGQDEIEKVDAIIARPPRSPGWAITIEHRPARNGSKRREPGRRI